MFRTITPIILIAIALAGFFAFTRPLYGDITALRAEAFSYGEALTNSKALENERDKLTKKYNSLDPNQLSKLQILLPDNVDNIRLILEIERIAAPYGMLLKDVEYDTIEEEGKAVGAIPANGISMGAGSVPQTARTDYGTWDLAFSTRGTYNNFINFTRDLEKNLRIVDVASIEFSSDTDTKASPGASAGASPATPDTYTYNFKIKTYWLKN